MKFQRLTVSSVSSAKSLPDGPLRLASSEASKAGAEVHHCFSSPLRRSFSEASGRRRIKNKKAFSLLELMIASAILMFILIGMLSTYIACFELNEFTRNSTLVNNALQAKMETVREASFSSLLSLDGTTFSLMGFPASGAKGLIDVYSTAYSDLIYVRLVACWKQKSGRVIGEDKNLNGSLDSGEDDGDGILESPAEIVTFIGRIE